MLDTSPFATAKPPASSAEPALVQAVGESLANATPAALLAALARLNPVRAAHCLLATPEIVREAGDPRELSLLLDEIVRETLARHVSADSLRDLREMLLAYPDTARADAIASIVERGSPASQDQDRRLVNQGLAREPRHARLLRCAAELAIRDGDGRAAHQFLTELGRADRSGAAARQIVRLRSRVPAPEASTARVAILSSFTIDQMAPFVDLEIRSLGLTPSIYIAPFNSWAQELIGEVSPLRAFAPEITFLAVSIDDLVPELAGSMSAEALARAGDGAVERIIGVASRFAQWSTGILVVHGFHSTYADPAGVGAGLTAASRASWLSEVNARLASALRDLPRTYFFDVQDVLLRREGGALDNAKMRHLAGMRLSDAALGELARAYARYIAPAKGLTRKCVVLDLDNTLWGGIVGEDGPHGIHLGSTAPGVEFQELQRFLLALVDRGFLLALNSKNNPDDALEVIRNHEGMLLREDSFSAVRINWLPKPDNMRSIAQELNIGLESLVFVDDNPKERALMRHSLPQVLTPELPADPALYRGMLEQLPELQTLVVTSEDRARADQYRTNRAREAVRSTASTLDDYLRALDIVVEIAPASDAALPRVHQLFHRTNQFNVTTRRYEAGELAARARDPQWRLYTVRARDRFGDHGLVAVGLARVEPSRWVIDSFLMSCRVIGYGVETSLLATICGDAWAQGAVAVEGEFIPTKKNAPARGLFEQHGFTALAEAHATDTSRWTLNKERAALAVPHWISLVRHDA